MTQLHTPMPARSRNIISAGSCGTTRGGRGDGLVVMDLVVVATAMALQR